MQRVSVATATFVDSRKRFASDGLPVQLALSASLADVIELVAQIDGDALPTAEDAVHMIEPAVMADGFCFVVSHRRADGLLTWATRLAAWLSSQGCSGEVRVANQVRPTTPTPDNPVPCAVSGMILAGSLHPRPEPAAIPAPLQTLVDWSLSDSSAIFLEHRDLSSLVPTATRAVELLIVALTLGEPAGLICVAESGAFRRLLIDSRAHVVIECAGPQGVLEDAEELEALLVDLSSHVNYGFVRRGVSPALNWSDGLSLGFVDPPAARGRYFEFLDEEELDYVPDAFPVQLVTSRHVDRARDLSGWEVSTCGTKYLVKAPNCAAWVEASLHDTAAAHRARADFGSMVLDPELLRQAVAARQAEAATRSRRVV